MATQAQIEILRSGVKVWNRWRKENPQIEINLKLADLQDVDLAFAQFAGLDILATFAIGKPTILTNRPLIAFSGI
jgi:hypothetical protein